MVYIDVTLETQGGSGGLDFGGGGDKKKDNMSGGFSMGGSGGLDFGGGGDKKKDNTSGGFSMGGSGGLDFGTGGDKKKDNTSGGFSMGESGGSSGGLSLNMGGGDKKDNTSGGFSMGGGGDKKDTSGGFSMGGGSSGGLTLNMGGGGNSSGGLTLGTTGDKKKDSSSGGLSLNIGGGGNSGTTGLKLNTNESKTSSGGLSLNLGDSKKSSISGTNSQRKEASIGLSFGPGNNNTNNNSNTQNNNNNPNGNLNSLTTKQRGNSTVQSYSELCNTVKKRVSKLKTFEIIKDWKTLLEQHVNQFNVGSENFKNDDEHVFEVQERVGRLAERAYVTSLQQDALKKTLNQIGSQQKDMFRKVDDLEDQLQDMIDSGMMQSSRSYERKEVYHSATMLHEELDRMSSVLCDVANSLNRDFNHNTDGDNVVASIMSVLNAHHISLQSLSEQCESLGRDILMARETRRRSDMSGGVHWFLSYNYLVVK